MNYIEELLRNPDYKNLLDSLPTQEKEKILEYIGGTILPFVTQISSISKSSESIQTKDDP
jgi:hypothetical protein